MVETAPVVSQELTYTEKQNELIKQACDLIEKFARSTKGDTDYAVFFTKNANEIESVSYEGVFRTSDYFMILDIKNPRFNNTQNWVCKSLWRDPSSYFRLPSGNDWTKFVSEFVYDPKQNVFERVKAVLDVLKKEVDKVK